MEEIIKINVPKGKKVKAYTVEFEDLNITDRIKTFEDACEILGDHHLLVHQYAAVYDALNDNDINFGNFRDIIAYSKLRIIVAALNEGWEPKFKEGEYRYFPWFYFYTKEEYDKLDDEEKGRCVLRSGSHTFSYHGFVNCYAVYDASFSYAGNGSRLAFRTRELAEYAGRQFIGLYKDLFVHDI